MWDGVKPARTADLVIYIGFLHGCDGRHVGQALAHLARFVEAYPATNDPAALEQELVVWAKSNTNLLDDE